MPSEISVLYSRKSPPEPSPRQIRNVALLISFTSRGPTPLDPPAFPALPALPPLPRQPLPLLLNPLLELGRHVRNRLACHRHLPVGPLANDDVERAKRADFVGVVLAEVSAPAFLSLEPGERNRLRDSQQICEVERRVPSPVVFPVSGHADALGAIPQRAQDLQSLQHFAFVPDDGAQLLTH